VTVASPAEVSVHPRAFAIWCDKVKRAQAINEQNADAIGDLQKRADAAAKRMDAIVGVIEDNARIAEESERANDCALAELSVLVEGLRRTVLIMAGCSGVAGAIVLGYGLRHLFL
jgi:hypothetical protein